MADDLPTIPGYTIFGEVGRGAMGVIYRANQISLSRPVALKMLRKDASPDMKDRFQAEVEALGRLRHPHIAQVYDAGTSDARPYLALEFLDGGTLSQKLGGGALPVTE